MNNGLGQVVKSIINLAESGKDPNMYVNLIVKQHPQLSQGMTQLQNMAQGRSMQEVVIQLLKQNGIPQSDIDYIARLLGAK